MPRLTTQLDMYSQLHGTLSSVGSGTLGTIASGLTSYVGNLTTAPLTTVGMGGFSSTYATPTTGLTTDSSGLTMSPPPLRNPYASSMQIAYDEMTSPYVGAYDGPPLSLSTRGFSSGRPSNGTYADEIGNTNRLFTTVSTGLTKITVLLLPVSGPAYASVLEMLESCGWTAIASYSPLGVSGRPGPLPDTYAHYVTLYKGGMYSYTQGVCWGGGVDDQWVSELHKVLPNAF